jgi:hypothetical protein
MPKSKLTTLSDEILSEARMKVEEHGTITAAAAAMGIPRQTLSYRYNLALSTGAAFAPDSTTKQGSRLHQKGDELMLEYMGVKIETPEQLIQDCQVDLSQWEIVSVDINNWEVAGKIKTGEAFDAEGKAKHRPEKLWKTPLRKIHIKMKRKSPTRLAIEELLEEMQRKSVKVPKIKYPKLLKSQRRILELTIMDPHYGLNCFPPGADHAWGLDDCEALAMWAIEDLLRSAESYGPFEHIVFPFGNDFLHHDNLQHTTTAGTPQPEGMSYHHVFARGIKLAFAMVDRMKEVAPVKIYQIPGNHDRQSSYSLGHILWAYYHKDENVTVDASSDPYKFHKYGTNLIGYEHGHSIGAIRFAALMANECSGPGPRQGWYDTTTYREWHLGDQHRKGSSKPATFEEQGVSIEYLPGLTPPNEWHRLKAYNWQKRGAMGFVWDHDLGPRARIQVNLNSYTGLPTGVTRKDVRTFK